MKVQFQTVHYSKKLWVKELQYTKELQAVVIYLYFKSTVQATIKQCTNH
jgi:hypothetical protein